MRVFYQIAAFIRGLIRSRHIDDQLAEELRFHVERETQANVARGMSAAAAYRAARITVGSMDDAQETSRDERPGSGLRQLMRDVGFGARLLRKSPAFATTSVLIVTIAIGVVTAIFSVVYGVLLKPLPYRDPERIVSLWTKLPALNLPRAQVNGADQRAWLASNHVFEDIALVRVNANFNLVGDGEPERLQGARLSSNLFSVLGVTPLIGRTFTTHEQQPGRETVALLSHGLWTRRFGGDPGIVGRTIQLSGNAYTVVGVMRSDFQYPAREFQIWTPLSIDPRELTRETPGFNFRAVARLKPGVSTDQAQREMNAIAARLARELPATNRDVGVEVVSMFVDTVRPVRSALYVLLGAVFCLLLVACLNLANLLGARAASRGSEFAVRLALGASRRRLVSQALAEVMPILVVGGVLGVAVAWWSVQAFVAAAPAGLPRVESIQLNAPVLAFSIVTLTIAGLIASMLPASQAWGSDFTSVTKESSRSTAGGRRHARARRALVVAQIAFAVPLLAGASLLLRSFAKLSDVDPGFRADGALSVLLAVPRSKYPQDAQVAAFEALIRERVSAVPGVASSGMVNRLPLGGVGQVGTVEVEGSQQPPINVDWRSASPDYFEAIGIPLLQGRLFTERDAIDAPVVGLVDERFARAAWGGQNPIGKRFRMPIADAPWTEIVGVVGHIHQDGLDADPRPQVYWSYRQRAQDRMALVVRGNVPPSTLVAPVIQAIRAVDPEQPVYDVRTMQEVVAASLAQRRVTMTLLAAFGLVALLLASVGVYGVVAFGVTQRLREFGIRVALGAERARVAGLVVREGTSLAVAGVVVGLLAAVVLGGAMSTLVYEVDPRDLVSFAVAAGVLLVVAAVASYLPARQAAGVDPAVTLRAE